MQLRKCNKQNKIAPQPITIPLPPFGGTNPRPCGARYRKYHPNHKKSERRVKREKMIQRIKFTKSVVENINHLFAFSQIVFAIAIAI